MIYIGIDPGKTGGIAWIDAGHVEAVKMPDTERDIWDYVSSCASEGFHADPFAVIERVNAGGPRMKGRNSIFTFGWGYGGLRMALIAAGVPFEAVAPGKWQRAMGCLTKGDKNVSKSRAQELFPSIKVTHAVADALLLAEYCRRTRTIEGG